MKRIVTWLVFVAWLLPAAAGADQRPAKGKLLVATELVHGDLFAQTVVLLLHYDENGAMGIVVNRPTEIEPEELLVDVDAISGYSGTLYWGAGQLDREVDIGSWHVVPASEEHVFAEDPRALWERLSPPREHHAAAQRSPRVYASLSARYYKLQKILSRKRREPIFQRRSHVHIVECYSSVCN